MRSVTMPPGTTAEILSRETLVIAPHPDDEVLGCGGLVAGLAAAGTSVRVVFLSDGGGGEEPIEDRPAYAAARRGEAREAAERLGIAEVEHLDLPDGRLEQSLPELVEALQQRLSVRPPDLLLVPSPAERSADHRAAFAALHRLLAPLRDGDPLLASLRPLRILAYEVNGPLVPDLLIDVSDRVEAIARAMAAYATQEARHPYLEAALGLRRFRTLTLGPDVAAAEGYRELAVDDFRTRGPAALATELGGGPEVAEVRGWPEVSVVVRTVDRPALLAEALASLAASSYRRLEVVVVNDGGAPPEVPAGFPFAVRRLDLAPRRGRGGAANAGIGAATGSHVAFLDDDDLVEPEHFEVLAGLVSAAGVRVAYTDAAVGVYELDPEGGWRCAERRIPYSRDFDPELLALDNYIPFNTLLVERALLGAAGPVDESLPFFEDWELLVRLSGLARFHHLPRVTCEYRHFRGGGRIFGESPAERADFLEVKARVIARHRERLSPPALARVTASLRGEAVALAAERDAAREAEREAARHEGERHRLRGEVIALREERERLAAACAERGGELARLWEEEKRLRAEAESRGEHLARTYAEIERLNGIIGRMEATRAWRLHRWLARRGR
ncbi:MAG: PIG-L family deacetylase [Thermoanaerobaculia bacterium]|nr:PIG-L family deacetylase [Thermoanaerobaculia bacterium]